VSEAERLAKWIEEDMSCQGDAEIAAELRRLSAELAALKSAIGEPVGFVNAGHIHELRQKRIPYGYVYQKEGTGAEIPLYAIPKDKP